MFLWRFSSTPLEHSKLNPHFFSNLYKHFYFFQTSPNFSQRQIFQVKKIYGEKPVKKERKTTFLEAFVAHFSHIIPQTIFLRRIRGILRRNMPLVPYQGRKFSLIKNFRKSKTFVVAFFCVLWISPCNHPFPNITQCFYVYFLQPPSNALSSIRIFSRTFIGISTFFRPLRIFLSAKFFKQKKFMVKSPSKKNEKPPF
jgi:hypothetical protein